ncbi:MAG: hypothetical protein LBV77_06785 [Candidatus Adiutrix intracellularis]|nr:hypothetical protein [Candidatus Adiutrix intracellularis]
MAKLRTPDEKFEKINPSDFFVDNNNGLSKSQLSKKYGIPLAGLNELYVWVLSKLFGEKVPTLGAKSSRRRGPGSRRTIVRVKYGLIKFSPKDLLKNQEVAPTYTIRVLKNGNFILAPLNGSTETIENPALPSGPAVGQKIVVRRRSKKGEPNALDRTYDPYQT